MPKNKVFLINEGSHDYSQASTFGEILTLSKGFIARFHISKMVRTFNEAMKDSTEEDYILISGPATMIAMACAVFARKHGRLNLLIWQPDDAIGGCYICRKTIL